MKDGKTVRLGDRYEIVYSLGICSLEVAACEPRDAGKYTCVAENSQGTEECTCKVTVNGTTFVTYTVFFKSRDVYKGWEMGAEANYRRFAPWGNEHQGRIFLNLCFSGSIKIGCIKDYPLVRVG